MLSRAGLALIIMLFSFSAWGEESLLDRYHRLKGGLSATLPGTLISMSSTEQDGVLGAEISSILHYPFETVSSTLAKAENWCQFMPLHFNIKACTYKTQAGQTHVTLYSGRKSYQSPEESFQMGYQFDTLYQDDRKLSLRLHAERGPAKTRDYLIEIDTMSVEEGTMLHIHSSYRPSLLSSLLTRTYLNTLGRNKVGFSRITQDDESPLVQGIRGVIERNVMRYHLAIAAHLNAQSLAKSSRHEAALAGWFKQNGAYPEQLHEMVQSEYLTIKRKEWQNQQRLQQTLNKNIQLAELPSKNAL
jgi:hypothetical protein